jgi:hypothetical protein
MRRRTSVLAALVAVFAMVLAPAAMADMHTQENLLPTGRTVQNIDVELLGEDGTAYNFVGRIVNLDFATDEEGDLLASGRLIGQLFDSEGNLVQRVNERFTDVGIDYFTDNGNNDFTTMQDGVTQILFLELGPIFLDLLGLIVEVPDPIILEIRAERGPGQLLGNLLNALLGIFD